MIQGLEETRRRVTRALLDARTPRGHWEGELSSSALSTATAVIALALRGGSDDLVRGGLDWLARHQNGDGGFGDTVASSSNVSTTTLAWSALALGEAHASASTRAARWLERHAGSLDPDVLVAAIVERYGKDRTFSVPILTVAALCGRLGPEEEAFRRVPQLPFELAALPQRWFQWLRLPVVSYALPALIALGHVRHRRAPSPIPPARWLRDAARAPTLRLLARIQPDGGGFLEATPLTSFVAASLTASGEREHPVVSRGIDFLRRSARPDGSWPIDTNLATWLTTLAIGALRTEDWEALERGRAREWLLNQQYRDVHPYTNAPPGGWAWTDLPGGVPDADDTAGALLALRKLGVSTQEQGVHAGLRWLAELQNRDGGVPTFCRGWTNLPFDRSGADLTAHALRAWTAWPNEPLAPQIGRALRYLKAAQREDGAFVPLWFGNESAPGEENPVYGTSRVLLALAREPGEMRTRAIRFLLSTQSADGGWGGDRNVAPSIEETALAVQSLARCGGDEEAVARGVRYLVDRTDAGRDLPPAPIGFYFAKLWYFEKLYPVIFTLAALNDVSRSRN